MHILCHTDTHIYIYTQSVHSCKCTKCLHLNKCLIINNIKALHTMLSLASQLIWCQNHKINVRDCTYHITSWSQMTPLNSTSKSPPCLLKSGILARHTGTDTDAPACLSHNTDNNLTAGFNCSVSGELCAQTQVVWMPLHFLEPHFCQGEGAQPFGGRPC